MKAKEVLLKLNFLLVFGFVFSQKTNLETIETNDWVFSIETQQKNNEKSETNHLIMGRTTSTHSRLPDNGSLADILVIDPNDPNQAQQPPLIFTSEHNPPRPISQPIIINSNQELREEDIHQIIMASEDNHSRPPFGHNSQNQDDFNFWTGDHTVIMGGHTIGTGGNTFGTGGHTFGTGGNTFGTGGHVFGSSGHTFGMGGHPTNGMGSLPTNGMGSNSAGMGGRPTATEAPLLTRQPPFFVKVEPKSEDFNNRSENNSQFKTMVRNKRPDKPSKTPDTMPGFEPQPLPASTKPVSEKKDCVVLGRAGNCFPFYPLRNVFDCFMNGGIVAMDIVRCSWVRACCVTNFF